MSCFGGLMEEYRYLSIDRFDGFNLKSSAFFLSHCHIDHMIGLDEDSFAHRLKSRNNIFLYCSEVTKSLLLVDERYKHLKDHICELGIEEPRIIEIILDDGQTSLLSVTLLSAAHCPGSVMFFFEGSEGNVLYTGDFRLPKGSAKRMKNLHTPFGTKKPIRSVYADTTFCAKNSYFIPSREDCLRGLKHIVKDWLEKGQSNVIRLNVSAKYGYEYLFRALHEEFGTKIYCRRKSAYACLPETFKVLTLDANHAKIFVCFKTESLHKHWKNVDGEVRLPGKKNVLTITLSTMYFTYSALPHEIYKKVGENHYRFCFSFHSSYAEVCDFIKYLLPGSVYANVRPKVYSSLDEVAQNLCTECGISRNLAEGFVSQGKEDDPEPTGSAFTVSFRKEMPRKRVLSFNSSEGEDTQDHFESFLCKSRKKNDAIRKVDELAYANTFQQISGESTRSDSDFIIAPSPESKPPLQTEIDALHVKIALNFGLPPPT